MSENNQNKDYSVINLPTPSSLENPSSNYGIPVSDAMGSHPLVSSNSSDSHHSKPEYDLNDHSVEILNGNENDSTESDNPAGIFSSLVSLQSFVLEWHDVSVHVVSKRTRYLFFGPTRTREYRQILFNLSGIVRPGEFWAIMGPTGCGKSTLLNVLSERRKTGVTGVILANRRKRDHNWKRQIAYVLQEDYLFPILTVRENMIFQVRVRLDKDIPLAEKKRRVDMVISALNLSTARNTMIGNAFIPGVSGGERKRVNIAIQLLSGASLIFLDEPTSGLDTSTATLIISMLKELCLHAGYTVVTTIHQPSLEIFKMFSNLILLLDGHVIYSGVAKDAASYFTSIGLHSPPHQNPADFVMESVMEQSVSYPRDKNHVPFSRQILFDNWVEYSKTLYPISKISEEASVAIPPTMLFKKYPAGYWQQFKVLSKRSFYMDIGSYFQPLALFQTITIALLFGFIWLQTPRTEENFLNRTGALFFLVIFAGGFTPMLNVLYSFPNERLIILRERSEGSYPLSAYFLGKVITDLPCELILPLLFLLISYWIVGLNPKFTNFLLVFIILIFLTWASSGMGLAIASIIYDVKAATTLGTIFLLSLLLTSGFYIAFESIPKWISWIGYLSFLKYAYDGMVSVEIGTNNIPQGSDRSTIFVSNYGAVIGILLAFSIFFRLLSFIFLKLFFKIKR